MKNSHGGRLSRRGFIAGITAAFAPTLTTPAMGGQEVTQQELPSLLNRVRPIPPEDYQARREQARRRMARAGVDALLLMGGSSLLYFTGVQWGRSERLFGVLLPRHGEPVWICPAFERQRAEEQVRAGDLRFWEEHESPFRLIQGILREKRAARLGIEETIPYFVTAGLAREASNIARQPSDAVTAGCRMRKSPRETALMEVAAEATHKAIRHAFGQMRSGLTAAEISAMVARAHTQQGARHLFASVGIGPASAFPHGSARVRKLQDGDIVLIDAGAAFEGYQSDITRTTVFGRSNEKQRAVWEVVKRAQTEALAAAKPGVTAESIDSAARGVITAAGWGPDYKYFTHRLGHGIGLDGHEWPYLVRGNRLVLEPGMTFSDEPGVYIPGEFGVRLEDVMQITETGARLLTLQAQTLESNY